MSRLIGNQYPGNRLAFVAAGFAGAMALAACTPHSAASPEQTRSVSIEAQAQLDANNLKAKIEAVLGKGDYECDGDAQQITLQTDRSTGVREYIVDTVHYDSHSGKTNYYVSEFSVKSSEMSHGGDTTGLNAHDASVGKSPVPIGQATNGDYSFSLYHLENEWRVVTLHPYVPGGSQFSGTNPTGIEQPLTQQELSSAYMEADSVADEILAIHPGCDAPDHKKQV